MSDKKQEALSDIVQISRQYQRSIRVDADIGRADALAGYIFHATAAKSYSLAAPAAGVRKVLTNPTTSTAARTIGLSRSLGMNSTPRYCGSVME